MAADFPTNVVNLPNKSDGEKLYAAEYNKIVDEITAIETELKKPAADTIVEAADSAKLGGVAASAFVQIPYLKSVAAHSNTTWIFNPGSDSILEVSGMSVSIDVPAGAKVLITAGVNCFFNTIYGASAHIFRGTSNLQYSPSNLQSNVASTRAGFSFGTIDTPGAGNFTYSLRVDASGSLNPNVEFLARWIKAEILNE